MGELDRGVASPSVPGNPSTRVARPSRLGSPAKIKAPSNAKQSREKQRENEQSQNSGIYQKSKKDKGISMYPRRQSVDVKSLTYEMIRTHWWLYHLGADDGSGSMYGRNTMDDDRWKDGSIPLTRIGYAMEGCSMDVSSRFRRQQSNTWRIEGDASIWWMYRSTIYRHMNRSIVWVVRIQTM